LHFQGAYLHKQHGSWRTLFGAACILFAAAMPSRVGAGQAASGKPGDSKVNPKDGLRYRWIPPGNFTSGCSPGDKDCYKDEYPNRKITLTRGFWLGQTEVTQAAYERVTGDNPSVFQ
jgi:formylglycine-generating enzyme required for sulfatase activity